MRLRNRSLTRWGAVAVAGVLAVGLVGCSSGDSGDGGDEHKLTLQGTEVTLPSNPQRIISVHNAGTQALIEVGAGDRLVAAATMDTPMVPPANREAYAKIKNKIDGTAPAETLTQYDPDLIVTIDAGDPGANKDLAALAPTAIMKIRGTERTDWEGRTKSAAAILGTTDKFDALQEKLKRRQISIKTTYADVLTKVKVTVLDSHEPGEIYVAGTKSMIGDLFGQAGVVFADSVTGDGTAPDTNPGEFTASPEKLGQFLDADAIFVASDFDGGHNALQRQLLNNPLLKSSKKPVFGLGTVTISSFAQADYMLDQLEKALSELQGTQR
ncbi:ABC transporter substrate-binding protein [Gordonia amarae]|uniref:ABC transporter substrate-binding protein n=2 Tax=Gordonia amarae TaxID=36821 RepID=A0A857M6J4_9ACTN|nr:ABC transporter substrate-binding protein [Gordonia amarae]MCS3876938.1 iron complex transport system substrate-binding protein [Gordonia amarae]QHN29185.1 ABC transporter substrate-binding protein [Gordonia amarae]QHN37964.1 ABC transporter substrate-binding protein [Gordonia amarae]GAB07376.1 putative ABC transporter substrate binding protein [Gordonia amarae NBRC 15530]